MVEHSVRKENAFPKINKPKKNNAQVIIVTERSTETFPPVISLIITAKPDTPPVTRSKGTIKIPTPKASIAVPIIIKEFLFIKRSTCSLVGFLIFSISLNLPF